VALAAVGSLAAHGLGYLPHAAEGGGHVEAGPEPAPHLPLLAGLLVAVLLISLANKAWQVIRSRPPRPLVPGWFVAVPPLGWAFQEAAERRLQVESFPFDAAREPAFAKGLMVQLVFGVLAFLLARLLLACVRELLRLHQASAWPPAQQATAGVGGPPRPAAARPRQLALALGDYERGPPQAA
jgi:hypothetical protein